MSDQWYRVVRQTNCLGYNFLFKCVNKHRATYHGVPGGGCRLLYTRCLASYSRDNLTDANVVLFFQWRRFNFFDLKKEVDEGKIAEAFGVRRSFAILIIVR